MEKYQIFAVSTILLILANYWHLISSSPLVPRSFDYIAYGFFIFGIFKIIKK
ncbi:MAG TPA: hypothetical protein P5232_01255 [Candidatus Moranbacteria bacterium]|nr:hypothetical protein [Candidatus Moranbacteria bacterium]